MLRLAIASDIPAIQRIRHSVRENRLVSTLIRDRDVQEAIEKNGRGWVVEITGDVVAFAIGDARSGNIWALFVHPDHERQGYGRQLHDTMLDWLWAQGLDRLWLTTEPGTRAQRFYEAAGWHLVGTTDSGELRYEMRPQKNVGHAGYRMAYQMMSERLEYRPLTAATLGDFHRLVQDDHVRRYLMDGELLPHEWSEQRVRDSASLFERCGVGLWLAHQRDTGDVVGFCGFLDIPSMHPQPQLVYAMFERWTGQGYATEMARASIAEARRHSGLSTIVASVDEANVASVRVLEKLGFRRSAKHPGAFGDVLALVLEA